MFKIHVVVRPPVVAECPADVPGQILGSWFQPFYDASMPIRVGKLAMVPVPALGDAPPCRASSRIAYCKIAIVYAGVVRRRIGAALFPHKEKCVTGTRVPHRA